MDKDLSCLAALYMYIPECSLVFLFVYYCLPQATTLYWMGVAAERGGDMQSGDTKRRTKLHLVLVLIECVLYNYLMCCSHPVLPASSAVNSRH